MVSYYLKLFSTYFGSIQIFCTIRLTGHILYSGSEEKKYTKFRFFTVLDIQDIFYIPGFNKKLIPQNSGLCFPVSTGMGSRLQTLIPNGITVSDSYPERDPDFRRLSRLIPPISPGFHRDPTRSQWDPVFIFFWDHVTDLANEIVRKPHHM